MVAAEVSSDMRDRWLGRYRLRWKVASGGMGAVWLAQLDGPHGFGKWVAVKIMHPHLATDRRVVEMFLDEARIASRIQHSHVCTVLDFGEDQENPFLVMEYLHGETLASVLHAAWHDDGAPGLPWWIAVRVAADAARGLHAAHELSDEAGAPMGLVHRDVSPQNVFVQYEGSSKVVDFGVARARGRITTTKSGELKGKLAYMAPEQLRRGQVDRRADIWALGVVLWEAVAGRRLFSSENEGETVLSILQDPIPRLSDVRKDCPTYLAALVSTVLERPASKRPQTAAELAEALDRCLYQLGEPAGHAQVGAWMQECFREQRTAREGMLRRSTSQELSLPPSRDSSPGSHSALRSRVPTPAPARAATETRPMGAAKASVVGAETETTALPTELHAMSAATQSGDAAGPAFEPTAASLDLLPEIEPERITEPPGPPTVRAHLPVRSLPVAAIAVAAAFALIAIVAVAVAIGVIVGRKTADPVALTVARSEGTTLSNAPSTNVIGSASREPSGGGMPSSAGEPSGVGPAGEPSGGGPAGEPSGGGPRSATTDTVSPNGETVGVTAGPLAPSGRTRSGSSRSTSREPLRNTAERNTAARTIEPVRQGPSTGLRTGLGQVNLLAIPAANVTWRGRAMGRTPLALRLPAGRQRLSLRAARGSGSATITVDVRPGRTERRTVRLQ